MFSDLSPHCLSFLPCPCPLTGASSLPASAAAVSTNCPGHNSQALLWLIHQGCALCHTPPAMPEQLPAGMHCWKLGTQGPDVCASSSGSTGACFACFKPLWHKSALTWDLCLLPAGSFNFATLTQGGTSLSTQSWILADWFIVSADGISYLTYLS